MMDVMSVSLRRVMATECATLHALLADESIAPGALLGLVGDGEPDLLSFLSDEKNVALICEIGKDVVGAVLFHWQDIGVYEVHTMAKRVVRGRDYIHAVRNAIRVMFTCSDAMELYTRVPRENKAARGLVWSVGGHKLFERSDGTPMYVLRWSDWLWGRLGDAFVARGRWFHDRLEEQFEAQKREHARHTDNADHDRMVGVTCELILTCCIEKALVLYNRWAKLAGYSLISVVIPVPLVLNIGDALVQVDFRNKDFTLLDVSPDELVLMTQTRNAA